MSVRPLGLRLAELTIQGVNNEKIAKAQVLAARIRTGHEVGKTFSNGKVSKNSARENRLREAITNAKRAQKTAGSLPASLLTWVILHPATEIAKKAKDRLTQ